MSSTIPGCSSTATTPVIALKPSEAKSQAQDDTDQTIQKVARDFEDALFQKIEEERVCLKDRRIVLSHIGGECESR